MVNKIVRVITDICGLISLILAIFAFIFLTVHAMQYWAVEYNKIPINNIDEKMYQVSILIAILSGVMFFLKLFVNTITEIMRPYLKKK